jgi:hypothetical protein
MKWFLTDLQADCKGKVHVPEDIRGNGGTAPPFLTSALDGGDNIIPHAQSRNNSFQQNLFLSQQSLSNSRNRCLL